MDPVSIRRPLRRRKSPFNFLAGRRITPIQRYKMAAAHRSSRPISLPRLKCLERPFEGPVS
jgi:hypothetical protein